MNKIIEKEMERHKLATEADKEATNRLSYGTPTNITR
jgi:hypothetical protein